MTKLKVFMGGENGNDCNLLSSRKSPYNYEKIMRTKMKTTKSHTKAILSLNLISVITLLLILTGNSNGFEIKFEDPSQGFFLREMPLTSRNDWTSTSAYHGNGDSSSVFNEKSSLSSALPTTSIVLGSSFASPSSSYSSSKVRKDVRLDDQGRKIKSMKDGRTHTARFTVLKSARPVTLKAEYGPFMTRQTVPTQYFMPNLSGRAMPRHKDDINKEAIISRESTPSVITDFKPHQMDLSAHLVTKEVPKDNPVLRVLFHADKQNVHNEHHRREQSDGNNGYASYRSSPSTICVQLLATQDSGYKNSRNDFSSTSNLSTRTATCSSNGKDGTCLGQITLPASWWPPLVGRLDKTSESSFAKPAPKQPKVNVKVSYLVYETEEESCKGNEGQRTITIPETTLATVPLTFPNKGYRQVGKDDILHMLLPQRTLYPNSKIYVPVFLEQPENEHGPISAIVIRCRTRSGVRLMGVEETSPDWAIRVEINSKGNIATVTAYQKKLIRPTSSMHELLDGHKSSEGPQKFALDMNRTSSNEQKFASSFGPQEVFNWLLSIDDRDYDVWDKGKVSWQIQYRRTNGNSENQGRMKQSESLNYGHDDFENIGKESLGSKESLDHKEDLIRTTVSGRQRRDVSSNKYNETPEETWKLSQPTHSIIYDEDSSVDNYEMFPEREIDRYRLRAKLTIMKDDVQAVLPIAKQSELMNLAVLTGRQVAKQLKVFIVSHSGEIADVTLHSSCTSQDLSALKVTSSCTSVYVDGSETRGALKATIDVKYGTFSGYEQFTVWMPKIPLEIELGDSKLSQIKSWRVPSDTSTSSNKDLLHSAQSAAQAVLFFTRTKRSKELKDSMKNKHSSQNSGVCSPRYQQTTVKVFAEFLAEDPDSGRKEYFPSRGTQLDVTELVVKRSLRIINSRVAMLRGDIIQGRSPGKTDLKIISQITGEELGTREIRVAKNKETIRDMRVQILSGLRLTMHPDPISGPNRKGWSAKTHFSNVLTSKYQEGLLDIELVMTDGTVTNLRDINPSDYYLSVQSLDNSIIAFAPMENSNNPRVIALGSGQGKLLRVSLEIVDRCTQQISHVPLAVQNANVLVKFKGTKTYETSDGKNQILFPEKENTLKRKDGKGRKFHTGLVDDNARNLANIALQDDQGHYYANKDVNDHYVNEKMSIANLPRSSNDDERENHFIYRANVTPLEIGMYVLLTVFCAAMAVFVASCFVYVSRVRRQEYTLPQQALSGVIGRTMSSTMNSQKPRSVQNAHDWVWLGKNAVDRGDLEESLSVQTSGSRQTLDVIGNDTDDALGRKCNRLSYGSSTAEINVITNPNNEYGQEEDSINTSSEQFQQFLQVRRNQARKRQQQVFGMSALLPQHHRNANGGPLAPRGRHYTGRHRKLPTPPPGHPAFGRIPFVQYHNRDSSFSDREGYKNQEYNQTDSFSRASMKGIERDVNHLGYRSRGTAPPKRGTIIEEPSQEYPSNSQRNVFSDIQQSNNNQRMLNSPMIERKSHLHRERFNVPSYNDENGTNVTNHWKEDDSYDTKASSTDAYPGHDRFEATKERNSMQREHSDEFSNNEETKRNIDTGTYTKKSHFEVDSNNSASHHSHDYMRQQQQLENFQKEPPPYPLPVGYPIFASTTQMNQSHYFESEDERVSDRMYDTNNYSTYDQLPNPFKDEDYKEEDATPNFSQPAPPIRQSPASALPPFELEYKETDSLIDQDVTNNQPENTPLGEYIPLNPDIDKPSPPRLGKPNDDGNTEEQPSFCGNPFELTDEETCPVEPEKKLSPSHVFESTTLEQSLLLGNEAQDDPESNNRSSLSSFNSNTFVIKKRGSSSPRSHCSPSEENKKIVQNDGSGSQPLNSPTSSMHSSEHRSSFIDEVKSPEQTSFPNNDSISLDQSPSNHESFFGDYNDSFDDGNQFFKDEADNDDDIDCKEESINMDLDYDHLMAYFDNLKESSA